MRLPRRSRGLRQQRPPRRRDSEWAAIGPRSMWNRVRRTPDRLPRRRSRRRHPSQRPRCASSVWGLSPPLPPLQHLRVRHPPMRRLLLPCGSSAWGGRRRLPGRNLHQHHRARPGWEQPRHRPDPLTPNPAPLAAPASVWALSTGRKPPRPQAPLLPNETLPRQPAREWGHRHRPRPPHRPQEGRPRAVPDRLRLQARTGPPRPVEPPMRANARHGLSRWW